MKAIGFKSPFQLDEGNCFEEFNFDIPHPSGHELLVKVQSISVNPVDTKQRTMPVDKAPRVLGFDAVGVIEKDWRSSVNVSRRGRRFLFRFP